jgi:hypothetical protein
VKSALEIARAFERELTALLQQVWQSGDTSTLRPTMAALLERALRAAFAEGLAAEGAEMTSAAQGSLADLVGEQLGYVEGFVTAAASALTDPTARAAVEVRIGLWAEAVAAAGSTGARVALQERRAKLQWHTARDELVCAVCGPLNDKIVEAGESFGEDFEGKPIYNEPAHLRCRCTTTEYIE